MKRKVGYRPDYKWDYKPEDKINANTYPMCSFAYAIDGDKKVITILYSLLFLLIELKDLPSLIAHILSILID